MERAARAASAVPVASERRSHGILHVIPMSAKLNAPFEFEGVTHRDGGSRVFGLSLAPRSGHAVSYGAQELVFFRETPPHQ